MAVNEHLSSYSTTASSNTPGGGDAIGTDLDDHLRDIKRNVRYASNTPVQAAKTDGYTVTASDHASLIQVDSSATNVVIALLAAATAGDGFRLGVKLTKGTKCVIDANASETIDGTLSVSISVLNDVVDLVCDGSNWVVSSDAAETTVDDILTTQGDIVVEGASGAQRLALGTVGQYLTSDGTDVAWSSGAWYPILSQTASADSTVAFNDGVSGVDFSAYELYAVRLTDIKVGSTPSYISFTVYQATTRLTTNYIWSTQYLTSSTENYVAISSAVTGPTTYCPIVGPYMGTDDTWRGSGILYISNPSGTAAEPHWWWDINYENQTNPGAMSRATGGGRNTTAATAVDGIQFGSGANLTGTFKLYGIA
jgi:hypothetical protein